MDYSKLTNVIESLKQTNPLLEGLKPLSISYQPTEKYDTPAKIEAALAELGETIGWITWTEKIERVEKPTIIKPPQNAFLLEAELITADHTAIRVRYNNQSWDMIKINLNDVSSATEANALCEEVKMQAREKDESPLLYSKIWTLSEEQGVINSDAVFKGFQGGKQ